MRRIVLVVAAMGLLAACGKAADDDSGAPASSQPNQAGVAFVQGMIPHHQQAIEMAGLIDSRTDRPELTKLVKDVTSTQSSEVSKMQGWLQAWGKPSSGMGEMDHDASPMPGMMGQAEMAELKGLKGTRFDLAFVDTMTRHHQGAIEMATTELGAGSLCEVKRLAQQITTASSGRSSRWPRGNRRGRRLHEASRTHWAALGRLNHCRSLPCGPEAGLTLEAT